MSLGSIRGPVRHLKHVFVECVGLDAGTLPARRESD